MSRSFSRMFSLGKVALRIARELEFVLGLITVLLLFTSVSLGQQITATLSGTTYDQSGAVVPNAQVAVKNESTGDTRNTVSNGDGYFTVTALPPATYDVTITAPGFQSWVQKGVVLNQGDSRTLPNIALAIGKATEQVEVVAGAEAVAPVDTGEVSTTLNNHMVNDIAIQGRDAGELLKIMPGVVATNGLTQGSSFNDRVVGTNSGPVGALTADGAQPYGSMAYMLDGANLVDPGNMGTQIANINQDMTSEVKVLENSYDAQYAKGPVIFEAFSKSGGAQFHGEAYLYARNGIFNSIDAYSKSQGGTTANEHYYYPGGNIGGPVLLPFTHFNRNRDKLFFWAGYEYMNQQPQGTPYEFFVPTTQMRSGDFSPAYLASLGGNVSSTYPQATTVPCGVITSSSGKPQGTGPGCSTTSLYSTTNGLSFPGGIIPASAMDPNSLALLKLYPQPNIDPATHGGNNYLYQANFPTNRWEATGKVDYNITENTKLSVSYTRQDELDTPDNGFALWWAPSSSLPYPGGLTAATAANDVMANVTHVFSPTLTNEIVFTFAKFENPILPGHPSEIERSTIGFTLPEVNGQKNPQIPNIESNCCNATALAGFAPQGSFFQNGYGGAFIGLKQDPAIYDNLSKVVGTHTMKFGFYWDSNENIQSSSSENNGLFTFNNGSATSTGNTIADFLLGHATQYQQGSAIATDDLIYHQYSFYGQDSWKASKRLTVNYGIRLDHEGQWYDNGAGLQVWDPYKYSNSLTPPPNTGVEWHAIDSAIPQSGYKSPLFYLDPRVGFAYDVFGNGKTVLRGGFALFRYQLAFNSIQAPAEGPLGLYTISSSSTGYNSLAAAVGAATPAVGGSNQNGANGLAVLQMGDGRVPWTRDYNFTISQALPGRSLFEISYVGSESGDELIEPSSGNYLGDPNTPPLGAYFGPDPNPRSANYGKVISPTSSSFNANDYFPLINYQQIYLIQHGSYANFNGLQAQWQKQSGPITFLANYTFSKVLGTRDGETANGGNGNGSNVWPYSLNANYGVLAYDHTHVFNSAYIWNLPSPIHGNWLAKGVVNGWQLSGVTQLSSGAPIQPNTAGDLNVQWPNNFSNSTILGTNAATLEPVLTCDPRSNLKSGQYFNPACFAPPAPGQEGSIIWPYIHGPAYFDSDLSLYKNFKWGESRNIQFRISAFNFVNHPLKQFGKQNNNDEQLSFSNSGAYSSTNTNIYTTGYPLFTTGNREVEFALKFYF